MAALNGRFLKIPVAACFDRFWPLADI